MWAPAHRTDQIASWNACATVLARRPASRRCAVALRGSTQWRIDLSARRPYGALSVETVFSAAPPPLPTRLAASPGRTSSCAGRERTPGKGRDWMGWDGPPFAGRRRFRARSFEVCEEEKDQAVVAAVSIPRRRDVNAAAYYGGRGRYHRAAASQPTVASMFHLTGVAGGAAYSRASRETHPPRTAPPACRLQRGVTVMALPVWLTHI